jgi:DNA/RNA endonuclease YhcR with UshA esterase domain
LNSKFFQPSYISSDDLLPYAEKPSIEISGRGMLRRDHPSTTRIKADIQLSLRAVVMNLGEFNLDK